MIKITNGSVEREVTKGAFENLYSKLGFEIADKKVISKPEVAKEIEKEDAKESEKDSKRTSK
jgi:hypothetical protein